MDTTINVSVNQVNAYTNPSANQKKSSDKVAGSDDGSRSSEVQKSDADARAANGDTVELTATRIVSESNQAAAETGVEDIDAIAQRLYEVKQRLESEYESAQAQQVHQLDAANLVEVLS